MKTTKAQFSEFKAWFLHYQKMFNCMDYKIYFEHRNIGDAYGNITVDTTGRIATVRWNLVLDDELKNSVNPKRTAKHEALELLLSSLRELAEKRYITFDGITASTHSIIRTLEKIIK